MTRSVCPRLGANWLQCRLWQVSCCVAQPVQPVDRSIGGVQERLMITKKRRRVSSVTGMSGTKRLAGGLAQSKTTQLGRSAKLRACVAARIPYGHLLSRDDKLSATMAECAGSVGQRKIPGRPMTCSHMQRPSPIRCMQGAIERLCATEPPATKNIKGVQAT